MLSCIAVALCSCTDYSKVVFSDFRVLSIDSLKYSGFTDMSAIVNANLTVDNPYSAFRFKDIRAEVFNDEGKSIVEAYTDDGQLIEVAAKSVTVLEAPIRVHVPNSLQLVSLGAAGLKGLEDAGYTVNYSFAVARGRNFHKIRKTNVPLESLLKKEK